MIRPITANLLRRRGTILITTMVISIALAGTVIVLCRSMRVEMQASANGAAAAEASSVERGAEQYILALLANYKSDLRSMSEEEFANVPVGHGYFWLLRPDYDDPALPVFGLMEESAKINLVGAAYDELIRLPGMTYPAASSIMDWYDEDSNVERDGAEDEYYLSLPDPYYCKNAPFETVEELLMVREVFRDMLYGDGTGPPLGQRNATRGGMGRDMFTDPQLARGIFDLLTVYTSEPNQIGDEGQSRTNLGGGDRRDRLRTVLTNRSVAESRVNEIVNAVGPAAMNNLFDLYFRGRLKPEELDLIQDDVRFGGGERLTRRINLNAAPPAVLRAIEGLDEEDAEKLIAARSGNDPTSDSIAWAADALGEGKARAIGARVTWKTYQYSADILAVSGNGRAFKRVRIVVDTADAAPQIVYRRDITERGWPMEGEILASIRRGEAMARGAQNVLPGTGSRF